MFANILSRIGSTLEKHGLPYMIIGGQAVLLYGEPRLTRDIDITLGLGSDRLDEVLAVIQELSLKVLPEDAEAFVRDTMVLPALEENTGIRVDFIFSFTPYEEGAIERSRPIMVEGEKVNFASPEDLIIHKVFAGRPRDLEDVRKIILKNPEVDLGYIRTWLREFDKSTDLLPGKAFLETFEQIIQGL